MAGSRIQDQSPAAYGREALAEWGKAARYVVRAIAARRREGKKDRPPLKERINPSKTQKGGRTGDVADKAISKLGTPGKLASKLSLGSRIIERLRPTSQADADGPDADAREESTNSAAVEGNGLAAAPPPIAESIDVAVAIDTAFELCTSFADYPEFLSRVSEVEENDGTHMTFFVQGRGRQRQLDVELIDLRDNARLDWECTGEVPHSGVMTFHRLAPQLTRIELTVELEPDGLLDRLALRVHIPGRAIHEEMHRFKAYAELSEDPGVAESPDVEASDAEDREAGESEEPEPEDLADEEEPDDEEGLEDEGELEDDEEFDEAGDEDFEDEELDDEELEEEELEEELEPARSGR